VACHVSATWQKLHSQQLPRGKNMPRQRFGGAMDLFQTNFFLQGFISIFFLQGRKSKLAQITGTIIIFKPLILMEFFFWKNIFLWVVLTFALRTHVKKSKRINVL